MLFYMTWSEGWYNSTTIVPTHVTNLLKFFVSYMHLWNKKTIRGNQAPFTIKKITL